MTRDDTTSRTSANALLKARSAPKNSEHHAPGLVVYVADGSGGAVRYTHSDDGRTLSSRRIPKMTG